MIIFYTIHENSFHISGQKEFNNLRAFSVVYPLPCKVPAEKTEEIDQHCGVAT